MAPTFGQAPIDQVLFKNISREQGLPRANVYAVSQDSTGYMWIASLNGVNRYDGKEFKTYGIGISSPSDALVNDQKLYTDRLGKLWTIVGDRPLGYYNKEVDSFVPVKNIAFAKCMIQNKAGDYYIGTVGHGLYHIDTKEQDTVQLLENKDIPQQINRFTEFNNNVYAAAWNGIIKIDANNKVEWLDKPTGTDSLYNAISSSEKHGLWMGTMKQGLYKLTDENPNFEKFTGFKNHPLPDDLYIVDLKFDSRDRLWLSTYGEGVYLINFKKESIIHLTKEKYNPNSLIENVTSMAYEDINRMIWISTVKGISLYDPYLYKFKRLTEAELPTEMSMSMVNKIVEDPNGNIWLSTSGSGIFQLNSNSENIANFTTQNSGLSHDGITSIQFSDNELWATTFSKEVQIFMEDRDGNLKLVKTHKLDEKFIQGVFVDSDKNKWLFLLDKGVVKYDKNHGVIQYLGYDPENANTLPSNRIFYIREDDNKNLWFTTAAGICKYDLKNSQFTRYDVPLNNFSRLWPDKEGKVWIWNHNKGLLHFNPNTRKYKYVYDIKPTFTVQSMTLYEDWFWMGTSQGIIQINKNTGELIQHNNNLALQSLEFSIASYLDNNSGTIYLGGHKGINWFRPEDIVPNPYAPETVINKIELFDEGEDVSISKRFEHDKNTFTLHIASLHFGLPEKNQYKYRLLNFDNDWIGNENNSVIRYSNLPPGDYEFQVTSSNYDGVWDKTPATYSFSILNPWYATNMAILFYVLLTLLLIYLIYRYFKSRWELQSKLKFEHQESERLKDLDSLKNRLYTNISHEFRTPLTLITGPLERQLNNEKLEPKVKDDLNIVQKSAKRLLDLVEQLLDLAKLETGNLQITVSQTQLKPLVKQIISPFELLAKEKSLKFISEIGNLENGWIDIDILEKIFSNLLSNAIKYTPNGGRILVYVDVKNEHLVITVINSCVDLTNEELPRLFQRYYQSNRTNTGAGIGLSLVKELCVVSHGSIISNLLGEDEIQFTATLPIAKSAYQASELIDKEIMFKDNEVEVTQLAEIEDRAHFKKQKPILLIVEDDKDIRVFIRSIFKKEYNIKEAEDGKIGIDLANKLIPDLIISDVMMPNIDGIELTNTLKSNELTSHIPILLLTAKSGNTNEITGLKSGADDYITKPFHIESLKLKVKNLLTLTRKLQQKYSGGFSLSEIPYSNLDEKFLIRLQNTLNGCITEPELTAEELAKNMTMSRTQLHRKLKALSGDSATQFIRKQRTKLAKDLLENSDDTISEIAYKVGFNSPSYFVSCFKKDFKKSPSSFRN